MTRQKKIIILITSLSLILLGVIIGILIYLYNTANRLTTYREDTTIANAYIGGMYTSEAREYLTKNALDWTNQTEITLNYQGYEIPVDSVIFSINIPESIDNVQDGRDNPLFVGIKNTYKNELTLIIEKNQSVLQYQSFDIERLENDLLTKVAFLFPKIEMDLGDYISDLEYYRTEIAGTTITTTDSESLYYKIKDNVDEIELPGRTQFSLLEWNEYGFTDDELSIVATAMYELILYTNFNNIEKHITEKIDYYPNYAEDKKGYESKINASANEDLSFYNPNAMPYYITVDLNNEDGLVFSLRGAPFIDTIEVSGKENISYMEPDNIYIHQTEINGVPLLPGEERLLTRNRGMTGFRVIIERKITTHDGIIKYEVMNEDIYMPKPHVIIRNISGQN